MKNALHCSGDRLNASALTEVDYPDYKSLPFSKYGIAQLVRSSCTLNQARHLFSEGAVSQREFTRFLRIWGNSTYRSDSSAQQSLYDIGGQAAVERRYQRASSLYVAWRKKVLITLAKDCITAIERSKNVNVPTLAHH